jgi:hypothetical protein
VAYKVQKLGKVWGSMNKGIYHPAKGGVVPTADVGGLPLTRIYRIVPCRRDCFLFVARIMKLYRVRNFSPGADSLVSLSFLPIQTRFAKLLGISNVLCEYEAACFVSRSLSYCSNAARILGSKSSYPSAYDITSSKAC